MLQTQHVSSPRRPRLLAAAIAALLLTGVIAWGSLSRPADPAGSVADETSRPSDPGPLPLQTEAETASEAAAAAAEMLESLTTVVPLAPLNPPTAPPTTEPPMPTLEAPFGSPDNAYVVLIGGPSMTISLDLITGEMRSGPEELVNLLLVVDDFVIWRIASTEILGFSPLDDLSDLAYLDGTSHSTVVAAGVRPGTVLWVDGSDGTGTTVTVVSLETNEVIAEVTLNTWIGWGRLADEAEFVSPASGGVYRWSPAGYQRVLDNGAVAAQGQGLLLLVVCDEQLQCHDEWYDTADMEVRDLVTTPEGSSLIGGRVFGSGWISITSSDDRSGRSDLFNVRTGARVADVSELRAEHPVDVTADGTIAVGALGDNLQLIDLITGERALVTLPASLGMPELESVFVVPKSALGPSLEQFGLIQPAD